MSCSFVSSIFLCCLSLPFFLFCFHGLCEWATSPSLEGVALCRNNPSVDYVCLVVLALWVGVDGGFPGHGLRVFCVLANQGHVGGAAGVKGVQSGELPSR